MKGAKGLSYLFYLAWIFVSFSLLFKHTKTLQWAGLILFFVLFLYYIRDNKYIFLHTFRYPFILLLLFLISLFWFVLISPYKVASLEAFFLNYFFHVSLFFLFLILSYKGEPLIEKNIWIIYSVPLISSIIYYFFYAFYNCSYSLACFLFSSNKYVHTSYFKGSVVSIPAIVLGFFIYLGLFLKEEMKKKYFYLLLSLFSFIFLVYLGRRAALLGIFLASFILLLFSLNKIFKRIAYFLIITIVILTAIFFSLPRGCDFFFKSRDNLSLVFNFEYEKWKEAGSLGERLYILPIYFKKSIEEPFSGTGLGRKVQKRVLSETNKKALSLEHAHLLFLNIALQAGWHTALIFLFFYLWCIKRGYLLWRISKENPFYTSLFLFLWVFLILSLFEGMEEGVRFTPFWIASGMLCGYAQRYVEKR